MKIDATISPFSVVKSGYVLSPSSVVISSTPLFKIPTAGYPKTPMPIIVMLNIAGNANKYSR